MKFVLHQSRRGKDNPRRITSVGVGEGKMHREFKVNPKDDTLDVPDRYYEHSKAIEAHGFIRVDSGAEPGDDEQTGEDSKTSASGSTPRQDGSDDGKK